MSLKWKVLSYCLIIFSLIFCLVFQEHSISVLALISVLLGFMYAHSTELLHEVVHLKKSRFKQCLGFFLGFPMLISYSDYRFLHLLHHRDVATVNDTGYFDYLPFKNLKGFVVAMFALLHLKMTLSKLLFTSDKLPRNSKKEYRFIFLLLIVMFVFSLYFGKVNLFLWGWVVPYFFIANPLHFLIELPEHVKCDANDKDIFKVTRSIKSNKFISWFVNGHNWHVEHHWKGSAPFEKLSNIHEGINKDIKYFEESYAKFYYKLFKTLYARI